MNRTRPRQSSRLIIGTSSWRLCILSTTPQGKMHISSAHKKSAELWMVKIQLQTSVRAQWFVKVDLATYSSDFTTQWQCFRCWKHVHCNHADLDLNLYVVSVWALNVQLRLGYYSASRGFSIQDIVFHATTPIPQSLETFHEWSRLCNEIRKRSYRRLNYRAEPNRQQSLPCMGIDVLR